MRCNICNHALTDKEVTFNEDLQTFEPCTTCLDIALDAAYSDGFLGDDDFTPTYDFGGLGDDDTDYIPLVDAREENYGD